MSKTIFRHFSRNLQNDPIYPDFCTNTVIFIFFYTDMVLNMRSLMTSVLKSSRSKDIKSRNTQKKYFKYLKTTNNNMGDIDLCSILQFYR